MERSAWSVVRGAQCVERSAWSAALQWLFCNGVMVASSTGMIAALDLVKYSSNEAMGWCILIRAGVFLF